MGDYNLLVTPIASGFQFMQITQEQLKQFRQIWKKDHPDQDVDSEVLAVIAQRVLLVVDVIYFRQ